MADQIKLNTRLQLRYDLLTKWNESTLPLLAGEVAIAQDGNNIIIKVGQDGVKTWNDLPVANVTPAQYSELAGRVSTLEADLNTAVTGVKARLTQVEADIDALEAKFGEGEGSVADMIADAVAAEATLRENADNAINAKIGTVEDGKTVVGLINAEVERADAEEKRIVGLVEAEATTARAAEKANADAIEAITNDYLKAADKTELEGKITAEADRAKAAEKANADAIAVLNGDANTAGSVAKAVADEKARAEGVENGLDGRLTTAEGKLTTLIGEDANKSVRTIANEELAAQLLSGKADADFKTLQELAAWLEDHPEDVADINKAIQDLQNKTVLGKYLDGEEEKEYATVKAYVEAAVQAEADRATGAENALDGRLDTLEAKFTGDDSVENKITAALNAAQDYTDDEIAKLVNEGAVKTNTNAIAAINNETTGILAKAKEYADGLNTAMDTRVDALEATVNGTGEGEAHVKGLTEKVADNAADIAAINHGTTGILAQANAYTNQEVGKLAATVATTEKLGLVKASDTVAVAEDGKMSVAKVSTDVLVQGAQEVVLHGGNATGYGA